MADDNVSSDVEATMQSGDAEAAFVERLTKQWEELDEKPEETDQGEEQDEGQAEEQDEESDEGQEDQEQEEQEEEDKVSIRINGKKADVNDLLAKTQHTVKIDGEEAEVGYDELVNGYQRGADYTRKTTELKREREDLLPYVKMVSHAKTDPQFVQYVQSYFENGPYPEAANNPLLKVNDEQLAAMLENGSDDYDPHKAAEVVKARQQWQAQHREREHVTKQAQEEAQRQYKSWLEDQIGRAREMISELGGSYEEDSKDVLAHLAEAGFSEQEIQGLGDARMALIAWEAAQYHKLKDSQTAPRARIGAKRKNLSPPRTMPTGKRPSSKQKRDTYRRATQTQKTDDWISAISNRLKV